MFKIFNLKKGLLILTTGLLLCFSGCISLKKFRNNNKRFNKIVLFAPACSTKKYEKIRQSFVHSIKNRFGRRARIFLYRITGTSADTNLINKALNGTQDYVIAFGPKISNQISLSGKNFIALGIDPDDTQSFNNADYFVAGKLPDQEMFNFAEKLSLTTKNRNLKNSVIYLPRNSWRNKKNNSISNISILLSSTKTSLKHGVDIAISPSAESIGTATANLISNLISKQESSKTIIPGQTTLTIKQKTVKQHMNLEKLADFARAFKLRLKIKKY